MKSVNFGDPKAHLSELVEQAAAGEAVGITRRGKPVAQIVAANTPRKPISFGALQGVTAAIGYRKASQKCLSSADKQGSELDV
jgi:prevent-host-death family protein